MEPQPKPDSSQHGISRRTVATGAAWAIPTIGFAATLPAYAASAPVPAVVCPTNSGEGSEAFLFHSTPAEVHWGLKANDKGNYVISFTDSGSWTPIQDGIGRPTIKKFRVEFLPSIPIRAIFVDNLPNGTDYSNLHEVPDAASGQYAGGTAKWESVPSTPVMTFDDALKFSGTIITEAHNGMCEHTSTLARAGHSASVFGSRPPIRPRISAATYLMISVPFQILYFEDGNERPAICGEATAESAYYFNYVISVSDDSECGLTTDNSLAEWPIVSTGLIKIPRSS